MLYPVLCVINLLFCIGKYVINFMSGSDVGGLFLNKTGDLSDIYYVQITPKGWTFSIWGIIYTWEALWIVFSLINICRKGPNGPAYQPYFIPPVLFVMYCVSSMLNVAWLITFDRQEIEVACTVLIVYFLWFCAMLFVCYRALDKVSPTLVEENRTKTIWLTRGLAHNAIAMQGTWATIAATLNIAMVMTYRSDPGVNVTDASTVSLSILSTLIVLFATSDLFFLDRYSRYTITSYFVLVWALTGSLAKNYEEGARNSVFTVVLLVVCSCLFLIKVILTVYRHVKRPRYRTNYDTVIGDINIKGQLA